MPFSSFFQLPLHHGKAPKWLFFRMVKLSKVICRIICENYGERELLNRMANGFWFQALGCVLGFDWHSSGITTTTLGALKIALTEMDVGIRIVGGKGQAHKIEKELDTTSIILGIENKKEEIFNMSRLVAKLDNACVQDNHDIYQHSIIVDEKARWVIVQQGMNKEHKSARRYHFHYCWKPFEKAREIAGPDKLNRVLNLSDKRQEELRKAIVDAIKETEVVKLPRHHLITTLDLSEKDVKFLKFVEELNPKDFKELLLVKGMGKKKIRALALTANLIYGSPLDWKDPIKYAFAHGGKDGTPFPVDKKLYDETIGFFKEIIANADSEKERMAKNLNKIFFTSKK